MKPTRILAVFALLLVLCPAAPSQEKKPADPALAEFPPLPLSPTICVRRRKAWTPPLPQGGRKFLDQDVSAVEAAFATNSVYVATPYIQLFYVGGPMKLGPKTYPRVRESVEALSKVYPSLRKRYPVLKRKHVAHLLVYHMHRVMQESWRVFGTNRKVYATYFGGKRMRSRGGFEGAIFKSLRDYTLFADRFIGKSYEGGERTYSPNSDSLGFVLPTARGSSKEPSRMINNVVNTVMQNFVTAEIGSSYRVPIWLMMGFAHWFEAREGTDFHTYWFDEGSRPEDFAGGDWRSKIRSKVFSRDVPLFDEFMTIGTFGECKPVHRGVAYGLADYMLREHLDDLREFVRLRREGRTTEQRDDFKKAFEKSPAAFYEDWKAWVRENYSKEKIQAMPKASELFTGKPIKKP